MSFEGKNGHHILNLECNAVYSGLEDHCVSEVSTDCTEIFAGEAAWEELAALTAEEPADVLALRVDFADEEAEKFKLELTVDENLKLLGDSFEETDSIGSQLDVFDFSSEVELEGF